MPPLCRRPSDPAVFVQPRLGLILATRGLLGSHRRGLRAVVRAGLADGGEDVGVGTIIVGTGVMQVRHLIGLAVDEPAARTFDQ